MGRARGWVRQALNAKALGHSVGVLMGHARYVQAFWKAHALMRCAESRWGVGCAVRELGGRGCGWGDSLQPPLDPPSHLIPPSSLFLPLLQSLETFEFLITVEDAELNTTGDSNPNPNPNPQPPTLTLAPTLCGRRVAHPQGGR